MTVARSSVYRLLLGLSIIFFAFYFSKAQQFVLCLVYVYLIVILLTWLSRTAQVHIFLKWIKVTLKQIGKYWFSFHIRRSADKDKFCTVFLVLADVACNCLRTQIIVSYHARGDSMQPKLSLPQQRSASPPNTSFSTLAKTKPSRFFTWFRIYRDLWT